MIHYSLGEHIYKYIWTDLLYNCTSDKIAQINALYCAFITNVLISKSLAHCKQFLNDVEKGLNIFYPAWSYFFAYFDWTYNELQMNQCWLGVNYYFEGENTF